MEFEKVFATIAVVLVVVIAFFNMFNGWNNQYETNVGESANETYTRVQTLSQQGLFNMSVTASNSTIPDSGSGTTSTDADLVQRGLQVVTSLPTMLGLVPALFQDFAIILGVPSAYVNIASWVFIFSFAALFAYLLIIGVRRLL